MVKHASDRSRSLSLIQATKVGTSASTVAALYIAVVVLSFFFFFQAEDGIRDHCVTGFRRVLFRSLKVRVADAVGRAHEAHGDLERDLLVATNLVEIDVDDVGAERMALDLADQRPARLAVDAELDERALRLDAGERLFERERVHHQRLRGAAVAVDHGRNLLLEACLPRRALTRFLAQRRGETHRLCHTLLSSIEQRTDRL